MPAEYNVYSLDLCFYCSNFHKHEITGHHNKLLIHVLYTLQSIYCSYSSLHCTHCFDKS